MRSETMRGGKKKSNWKMWVIFFQRNISYHKRQSAHVNVFEVLAVVRESCEIVQIGPGDGCNGLRERFVHWKCIIVG